MLAMSTMNFCVAVAAFSYLSESLRAHLQKLLGVKLHESAQADLISREPILLRAPEWVTLNRSAEVVSLRFNDESLLSLASTSPTHPREGRSALLLDLSVRFHAQPGDTIDALLRPLWLELERHSYWSREGQRANLAKRARERILQGANNLYNRLPLVGELQRQRRYPQLAQLTQILGAI